MKYPVLLRRAYEAHGERHATYLQVGSIELEPQCSDVLARLDLPIGDGVELVVLRHPPRDAVFSEVQR